MIREYAMIALAAVAVTASGPAAAQSINMLVSWPESNGMAYMPGVQFKENLEAKDVGLSIQMFGPETVPPFEQIDPVSSGVFDMIYTHPAYHDAAITSATNAMRPDMEKIRSSGVFGVLDSYMQETQNLKLLANVAIGTNGYHCYLSEPLDEAGTWEGRKIRGIATYVPVIQALGGVTVNTPMGQVYSGIDRGVVDGACAPQSVYRSTRHYEVARYRTEPTFGQLVSYIAINVDVWNSLSEEQRTAMTEAARETEEDVQTIGNEAIAEDLDWLAEQGVEVTEFTEAAYDDVLTNYRDGVWQLVSDCCGENIAEELRGMAVEAGLEQ